MFQRIAFKGLKESHHFGYAAELPFFKGKRELNFKPGLNILFGPNGCGKSTVLQILARTMCASQGGVSVITEAAVQDGVDMFRGFGENRKPMRSKVGLQVEHDGQPLVFCDPRASVGLLGGQLDEDFLEAGINEAQQLNRASHGQQSLARSNVALGVLFGKLKFPTEVPSRLNRKRVNDVWLKALDILDAQMRPSIPTGQRTVLLDEPEANFSLAWQVRLWEVLERPEVADNFQVIVASHSPFAVGIKHANYIDFVDGFRQECEGSLRKRFGSLE